MRNLSYGFVVGILLMYSLFHWFYPQPQACPSCSTLLNTNKACYQFARECNRLVDISITQSERLLEAVDLVASQYSKEKDLRESEKKIHELQVAILKMRIEQMDSDIKDLNNVNQILREQIVIEKMKKDLPITDDSI